MDKKKRVRRGESFGRMGVDRSISHSLKCPTRQKQRCETDATVSAAEGKDDTSPATKPKLKQVRNTVRFAEETPFQYLCSHYDEGMTPEQQAARREELWYSKRDFEDFLKDRVATIRLLKMVQGNATALRENYPEVCLRGLEPFESNPLNQELQCQREWHQRVVLAEQSLQRREKQDLPDRIRQLAVERSEWAGERARSLASLDEMEVKLADAEPQVRRRSLASAQIGMQNLSILSEQRQQQRRRASLSLTDSNATRNLSRRAPVDLAILKEWNAKFLDEMRKKGSLAATSSPTATGVMAGSTGDTDLPSSISLLSDKTAQSRMALRRQSDSFMSPGASALMATNTSSLGYGERITSTNCKDITANCFRFPVRRDSLVGFRRESLLANRAAALAGSAGSSAGTGTSAATGGFRFPVRREG